MGRPRKSVELRLLEGSYEPGRHGPLPDDSEPREPPEKPAGMAAGPSRIWAELVSRLSAVLRRSDGPVLGELCEVWWELKRVRRELAKSKPGEKGYNQLLVGMGICLDKVNKMASLFGLSPSDRAKLRFEQSAGPAKARVATRPKTKLDQAGPPKGVGS